MPVRLTCSSICFRSQSIDVALREIRAFGFETVELAVIPGFCPHFDAARASDADVEAFIARVRESSLRVPVLTAVPGQLNEPDADVDAIVAAGAANARLAQRLGAGRLNINAGKPVGSLSDRALFREHAARVAPGLRRIARAADELGLRIGLEVPHRNGLCRTLGEAEQLLELISHPAVDVLLDVTHVQAGGARPEDALGFFGERVAHIHLRDGKGEDIFFLPGDGDIDFASFLRVLDRTGYRGLCALELEGHGESLPERRAGLEQALSHLRALSSAGPALVYAR